MTKQQWERLKIGDIVRNKSGSEGYTITGYVPGGGFIATRTITALNPIEWHLICKECGHIQPEPEEPITMS